MMRKSGLCKYSKNVCIDGMQQPESQRARSSLFSCPFSGRFIKYLGNDCGSAAMRDGPLLSSECERHQVPRQKWPPHADPREETLQVPLREELQDLAGPETPHHQLPPPRLHRDPAQNPGLEPAAAPTRHPKTKPWHDFARLQGHALTLTDHVHAFKSLPCIFCCSFLRYTIFFTHFLEQKSIFVVFLTLNICTFVYAITLLYFLLLFDIHKVLPVKKKNKQTRKGPCEH